MVGHRLGAEARAMLWLMMFGCPGPAGPECTTYDEVFVWVDADGDGFGSDQPIGYVCTPGPNEATNKVDCDDENPDVNPGMDERCDLLDNDCNQLVDETWPKIPWYPDADGDGFGAPEASESACQPPGPDYIELAGDCDDTNAAINPTAIEVCDQVDNDCDTLVDDADPGVDPMTYTPWYRDLDGDGYGDRTQVVEACAAPSPSALADGSDCDDGDPGISPDAIEICDDIDNDCDDLVDDFDPDVDPATQDVYFADTDGDGYGDPNATALACEPTPGYGVDNADDCDDSDPWANVVQPWYLDNDGDGAGVGVPIVTQCLNPGPGLGPQQNGVDCDDADPLRAPHLPEVCEDDIDQDCTGGDIPCAADSCKVWRDFDPSLPSGVYEIWPNGFPVDVYCDMTVDGGGWTLVGSSFLDPLDDAAGPYHSDLLTLNPVAANTAIWSGLRGVMGATHDIRFTCKLVPTASTMAVDLSYYDVNWYDTITTGTDAQSCFYAGGLPGPFPERRNNLNGQTRPVGDPWNSGVLEGEDSCSDLWDFSVDFDDRGSDGNQSDGTDWGEDDGSKKCGTSGIPLGAWFVFVREP